MEDNKKQLSSSNDISNLDIENFKKVVEDAKADKDFSITVNSETNKNLLNLSEIQSLISIKNYVHDLLNNYGRDKKEIKDLQSMFLLIDNRIVEKLLSDDFKNYINFSDAKKATERAAELNNIKSGMIKR